MQTITYESLERRFQSVAGLATLDLTDKFFFQQTLNSRLREAWERVDWPELLEIKSVNLVSNESGSQVAEFDGDVLQVWDRHPWKERGALNINYNIVGSEIVLQPGQGTFDGKIFLLSKKPFGQEKDVSYSINVDDNEEWYVMTDHDGSIVEQGLSFADASARATTLNAQGNKYTEDYEGGSSIPKFFENYLITAILADFLRGDGQHDASTREEAKAEEHLTRQIDRVENLQQQNRPVITQYGVSTPYTLIYQS